DVIELYGTDALRFALGSVAVPGRDVNVAEERIEGNRNFVNKIWNAARLIMSNLEGFTPSDELPGELELADRWIMSRLAGLIERADEGMDSYNFSVAGKALYQFIWGDFCDWYLELIKARLYQGTPEEKHAARSVACKVLECALRLMHPFMPFVTEELWQKLPGTGESIMIAEWPDAVAFPIDEEAEREMGLLQSVIVGIRSARSEHGIPPNGKVDAVLVAESDEAFRVLQEHLVYLVSLAGLASVEFSESVPGAGYGMRVVAEGAEAFLSWESGVDPGEEIDRLGRKLAKVEADLEQTMAKLGSDGFLSKAPPAVVDKVREKERDLTETRQKLNQQIEALRSTGP
ncbi:MAG TPA: class I tRNA ligase family protein, partial [Candidatus Anoxymicrobiaceae bacterium]